MKVFVTGSAGFIGFHLARALLEEGHLVAGYDGLTPYYDPALKRQRHAVLRTMPGFTPVEAMLEDAETLGASLRGFAPDIVVHLAAQPGVRYGLENPGSYISANLLGTANLLEAVKDLRLRHLLFASTSSVYGGNQESPFAETDRTDYPLSLYAATKSAGEALTHAYAHLHRLPTTCFRFFTVYGPWGRPDMALFKFVAALEADEPIDVYGHGAMARDFTYVGDLITAVRRLIDVPPTTGQPVIASDSLSPTAPWRTVNIAGGHPATLPEFIAAIEAETGRVFKKRHLPVQPGDMTATSADTALLEALTGYRPRTKLDQGIRIFLDWYREYRATLG